LFVDQVLRKSLVTVTEDLSKRTRESRQELRKFMRQVRRCVEQTRGKEVYETGEKVCRADKR
jgi:hypothetical protein